MNIDRNKKIPDGTKFVRLNDVLNLLCEGCLEDCDDPNLMCDFHGLKRLPVYTTKCDGSHFCDFIYYLKEEE